MFKNYPTTIDMFALDISTNLGKTGDAANITAYVIKNAGVGADGTTQLASSATEIDPTNARGWYRFSVAQTENNAYKLLFTGKSVTSNVQIIGRPITTVDKVVLESGVAQSVSAAGVLPGAVRLASGAGLLPSGSRIQMNSPAGRQMVTVLSSVNNGGNIDVVTDPAWSVLHTASRDYIAIPGEGALTTPPAFTFDAAAVRTALGLDSANLSDMIIELLASNQNAKMTFAANDLSGTIELFTPGMPQTAPNLLRTIPLSRIDTSDPYALARVS